MAATQWPYSWYRPDNRDPTPRNGDYRRWRRLTLVFTRISQHTRSRLEEEAHSLWNSAMRHSNEVFHADGFSQRS
jgi:hypothetical protein